MIHVSRRRSLLLVMVAVTSIALLTAVAWRVDGSRAAPLPIDADATVLTCEDSASRPGATGVIINNAWNRASAGAGAWKQCLVSRVRDGRTEYGWYWHWPSRDGIYAYPEQLIGRSPWGHLPSNDNRFPQAIDAIESMPIAYEVESRFKGRKNLAVEFWLTDPAVASLGPAVTAIKAELMIWTDESPGLESRSDPPAEVVNIAGQSWSVQARPGWGDVSGGSGHRWMFVTYRAIDRGPTARYDARQVIQHAIDRGWIEPQWLVEGVEFGNEIISGSGSTFIRRFDLKVE